MYISKDGERLYLRSYKYNVALILSQLAKIVENYGGRVKPTKRALISNASIDENISECEKRIEHYKNVMQTNEAEKVQEAGRALIRSAQEKINELQQINNEPILVTHTSYISFVLDDDVYYFQIDDNPFFPDLYSKTPLYDDKYSKDAALDHMNKEWLFDCFLSWDCSRADIVEAANMIFNYLCNAKYSEIIRDRRRERVPNTYNSGYHYETIYAPERFAKLDY